MKIRNATPETPAEALVARNPLARTYSPSKQIFLFLFLSLFLSAAATAAAQAPGVPARIEQLAFMAGSWGGPAGGAEVEEVWLAPKGGLMLGLGRTVKDGKAVDWEFMRIEEQGGTLVYLAMPGGKPATPFPLAALDATSAVFEGALEFPRRVSYRKNPDGTLTARIEGMRNGKSAAREWTWRRVEAK
jgi:hypothetical protein